jgi:hypothetical protein
MILRAGNDNEELEDDPVPRLSVETTDYYSGSLLNGEVVVNVERVQLHQIMSTDGVGPWFIGVLFAELRKEKFQDPRELLLSRDLYVCNISGKLTMAKMSCEERTESFFVRVEFHLVPH